MPIFTLSKYLFLTFSIGLVISHNAASSMQQTTGTPLPQVPEHFDHRIDGCPANSMCTINMGKIRKLWIRLLKDLNKNSKSQTINGPDQLASLNKFASENGFLIPSWAAIKANLNPEASEAQNKIKDIGEINQDSMSNQFFTQNLPPLAYWDSACPSHTSKDWQIVPVVSFEKVKSMDAYFNLHSTPYQFFQPLWLGETSSTGVNSFQIVSGIRGETPIAIHDGGLIYLMEEEGVYYYLQIKNSRPTFLSKPNDKQQWQFQEFERIECPKETKDLLSNYQQTLLIFMQEKRKGVELPIPIFSQLECFKVSSRDQKKSLIVANPISCL